MSKKLKITIAVIAVLSVLCMAYAVDYTQTIYRFNKTYTRTMSSQGGHMNASGTTSKVTTVGFNDYTYERCARIWMYEYDNGILQTGNSQNTLFHVGASSAKYITKNRDYDDMSMSYMHRHTLFGTNDESLALGNYVTESFTLYVYQTS